MCSDNEGDSDRKSDNVSNSDGDKVTVYANDDDGDSHSNSDGDKLKRLYVPVTIAMTMKMTTFTVKVFIQYNSGNSNRTWLEKRKENYSNYKADNN